MTEFRLPDVGEGLESAEIVEWLVAEGDRVERDQPLVEILTDKSQTQLPSPQGGVIRRLGFAEGDVAEVGQTLVEFAGDAAHDTQMPKGSEASADRARDVAAAPARQQVDDTQIPKGSKANPADSGNSSLKNDQNQERVRHAAPGRAERSSTARAERRSKASPVVRRRALQAGVDLADVTGTGPGGRITNADLTAHLEQSTSSVAAAPARQQVDDTRIPKGSEASAGGVAGNRAQTTVPEHERSPRTPEARAERRSMDRGTHPLRGIRRVTAESMTRSWEIPHIHGNDEADATELLAARKRMKERDPEATASLTPLSFFTMAVANGLRRFPLLNASIDTEAGTITVHEDVNIGIAVASEQGLVVPVIRNADQRSLFNLSDEISRLSVAVRDRTVSTADLQGGTATISNYGSLGGRFATPIIKAPEVLIVGFGSIRPRPFVVDGEVVARSTLPISIAVDHRLIDGDLMTAFQEYVIEQLSDPVSLLAR